MIRKIISEDSWILQKILFLTKCVGTVFWLFGHRTALVEMERARLRVLTQPCGHDREHILRGEMERARLRVLLIHRISMGRKCFFLRRSLSVQKFFTEPCTFFHNSVTGCRYHENCSKESRPENTNNIMLTIFFIIGLQTDTCRPLPLNHQRASWAAVRRFFVVCRPGASRPSY